MTREETVRGIAQNLMLKGNFLNKELPTITTETLRKANEVHSYIENNGITFLPENSEYYPKNLRTIEDKLPGLYVKSNLNPEEYFKKEESYLAVTGTRDISTYGIETTRLLIDRINTLNPKDMVLVTGLALGVDTYAIRSALDANMKVVAVMATGPEDIYPRYNKRLAEEILNKGGLLVTQFPPKTAPIAINFLLRNRVIAALCDSIIVTETKIKGGAMVTARLAYDYGKEVYAVPGRITDPRSAGCNKLISEGIASIIHTTD